MFTFRAYRLARLLVPYTGAGTDAADRIRAARAMGSHR